VHNVFPCTRYIKIWEKVSLVFFLAHLWPFLSLRLPPSHLRNRNSCRYQISAVQCSDICLRYCYQMQPQRSIASPQGRSKPGYPLADYAEFEKIHTNIPKHLPTMFSFSYASKGLSGYKMRYFAKLKFAPCTSRGQLKFSIAVRAERVCTHIAARTPSVYTWNC